MVVFIGDGTSDRFAAAHADMVFAKGAWRASATPRAGRSSEWTLVRRRLRGGRAAFEDGRLPATRRRPDALARHARAWAAAVHLRARGLGSGRGRRQVQVRTRRLEAARPARALGLIRPHTAMIGRLCACLFLCRASCAGGRRHRSWCRFLFRNRLPPAEAWPRPARRLGPVWCRSRSRHRA